MIECADTGKPIPVAEGVFWVGSHGGEGKLKCNPYLVVQDEHAVLIDGGSRSDFPAVMMKILQVGIDPQNIVALVYQHYDPDLCGSMANLIEICQNPRLKILSSAKNNIFMTFYIHKRKFHLVESIERYDHTFSLGGLKLQFIETPFSHNAGSFVTFDRRTGTLFSSDLFGSFSDTPGLYLQFDPACHSCTDITSCPDGKSLCPLQSIYAFHRSIMPCNKALRYAMRQIKATDPDTIAPQHGHIVKGRENIRFLIDRMETVDDVGIDGIA